MGSANSLEKSRPPLPNHFLADPPPAKVMSFIKSPLSFSCQPAAAVPFDGFSQLAGKEQTPPPPITFMLTPLPQK